MRVSANVEFTPVHQATIEAETLTVMEFPALHTLHGACVARDPLHTPLPHDDRLGIDEKGRAKRRRMYHATC